MCGGGLQRGQPVLCVRECAGSQGQQVQAAVQLGAPCVSLVGHVLLLPAAVPEPLARAGRPNCNLDLLTGIDEGIALSALRPSMS